MAGIIRNRHPAEAHQFRASPGQQLFFAGDLQSAEHISIMRGLGLVAQSVEQRIENPCVGGSIPPRATKKYAIKSNGYKFILATIFSLLQLW